MATPYFDKSVFYKYFNADDPTVLAWSENVLDKLIENGLANFLLRETKEGEDTDIAELYRPVAVFFSYLVGLARAFETFNDDAFLANQYLLNKGQYTSENESLDQLLYLIENQFRIRAQRGTLKMIEKAATSATVPPHGEVLRLLGHTMFTFFKLGVGRPEKNSWNVNNSGPLSRTNTGRYDLNIGYEYTEDIESKDVYPLLNENFVFLTKYRGKDCLEIESVPFGEVGGIGDEDITKEIIVDPRFNYEITFYVAQDITLENITFGVKAYNENGDILSLQNVADGSDSNYFFQTRRLNQAGKFYFIRGIIFNKDRELIAAEDAKLNIGFGHHLKMNENVVSIIPYIVMDNDTTDDSDLSEDNFASGDYDIDSGEYFSDSDSGESWSDGSYDGDASIFLWNIKVTPCAMKYNRCYLNNKNFIDVIVNNRNGRYTTLQIDEILRRYFIPYNTAFKVTHLGDLGDLNPEGSFILMEDGNYVLQEDENKIFIE